MTHAGIIMGTAAYMSPEQAKGKPADRRADIWAFGVVLYEMVTGQQLFTGETAAEILAGVIKDEPKLGTLPAGVRPIVDRCLRRDPRKRWQAIGDVRIALEEGLARGGNRAGLITVAILGDSNAGMDRREHGHRRRCRAFVRSLWRNAVSTAQRALPSGGAGEVGDYELHDFS